MSPRRLRRRAHRRPSNRAATFVVVAAALVLVALLVGGLTQVSSQSKGYDADAERTLAAQATVLAGESNDTSSAVSALMGHLPIQTRQSIQVALDSAVQQSASQSAQARLAVTSMPADSSASTLTEVFAERARSMTDLRSALDGFLGLGSAPSGSSGADASTAAGGAALLGADQATTRIVAAGALLGRSDTLWGELRRAARPAITPARLPASVWVVTSGIWQPTSVAAQLDLMASSRTLMTSHDVVLRTVRLSPAVLPPAPGTPAGFGVVSPTTRLGVTVVLANQGAADEARLDTQFTLSDQTSGTTESQRISRSLALGASVTLPTVTFAVQPGSDYTLTVQIVLPSGQTLTAATLSQQSLRVAPAS